MIDRPLSTFVACHHLPVEERCIKVIHGSLEACGVLLLGVSPRIYLNTLIVVMKKQSRMHLCCRCTVLSLLFLHVPPPLPSHDSGHVLTPRKRTQVKVHSTR